MEQRTLDGAFLQLWAQSSTSSGHEWVMSLLSQSGLSRHGVLALFLVLFSQLREFFLVLENVHGPTLLSSIHSCIQGRRWQDIGIVLDR